MSTTKTSVSVPLIPACAAPCVPWPSFGGITSSTPAADPLADEGLIPARDDLARADHEGSWHAALPRGVKDLAGAPGQALVLRNEQFALRDRWPGALDQRLGLERAGRRRLRDRHWRGDPGERRAHRRQFRVAGRLWAGRALRPSSVTAEHIHDEHQRVGTGHAKPLTSGRSEPVLGRDGQQ